MARKNDRKKNTNAEHFGTRIGLAAYKGDLHAIEVFLNIKIPEVSPIWLAAKAFDSAVRSGKLPVVEWLLNERIGTPYYLGALREWQAIAMVMGHRTVERRIDAAVVALEGQQLLAAEDLAVERAARRVRHAEREAKESKTQLSAWNANGDQRPTRGRLPTCVLPWALRG